jgi:hypothetical protein
MSNLIWIDLDVAAGWLSSNRDDVMCLIREGSLGSKRRSRETFVVRADDVRCLAEFWTVRKPRKARTHFRKRYPNPIVGSSPGDRAATSFKASYPEMPFSPGKA